MGEDLTQDSQDIRFFPTSRDATVVTIVAPSILEPAFESDRYHDPRLEGQATPRLPLLFPVSRVLLFLTSSTCMLGLHRCIPRETTTALFLKMDK